MLSKRGWKVACPAASASSGFAIRRLNGAGSLRRSASIRNNCGTAQKLRSRITAAQNIRITGAVRSNFALKTRSAGTEFLDAETGRQKSQPKSVNAGRDQNPGSERPEIRAERPYLASYRKRAVCGDWMVVCAVICEPVSL